MPALRYYDCRDCHTVSALPDTPTVCPRCGGTSLSDITADLQDPSYFLPSGTD